MPFNKQNPLSSINEASLSFVLRLKVMSTSGRLHGEFVRLLYILAHRRAVRFFATLDYEPCYEELCQRRGAFFFQHRARIGLAGAQAAALRMAVTLGLPRALVSNRSSPLTPQWTSLSLT